MWCGPGSNRRHKDFQSFALPTELPHHPSAKAGCKNRVLLQKTDASLNLLLVAIHTQKLNTHDLQLFQIVVAFSQFTLRYL